MEVKAKDVTGGALWFYGAGAVAVILSFVLFSFDQMLSHSKREEILGKTLLELRTAQASLGNSETVDPRLSGAFSTHP